MFGRRVWDPSMDGARIGSAQIKAPTPLAPKCPVIPLQPYRDRRDRRRGLAPRSPMGAA